MMEKIVLLAIGKVLIRYIFFQGLFYIFNKIFTTKTKEFLQKNKNPTDTDVSKYKRGLFLAKRGYIVVTIGNVFVAIITILAIIFFG